MPSDKLKARLDRIEALAKAASPGNWEHCVMANVETPEKLLTYLQGCIAKSGGKEFYFVSVEKSDGNADVCHTGNGPTSKENNAFIADSRTSVPWMAQMIRAQGRVIEAHETLEDAPPGMNGKAEKALFEAEAALAKLIEEMLG